MARGIDDGHEDSAAIFMNEGNIAAVVLTSASPSETRQLGNRRGRIERHFFHTLKATVVPTPTSEFNSNWSTIRLTPGSPNPSVPEEL